MKSSFSFLCFSLFTCFLFLSGCSTSAHNVRQMSKGKSIAVTSHVGNKIDLKWIGTTIFNNEYSTYDGYNIDEMIIKAAVDELKGTKRYSAITALPARQTDDCGKPPAETDYLLCYTTWTFDRFHKDVGIMQRTMFGGKGYTFAMTYLTGKLYDMSGAKIKESNASENWPAGFHLQSGPKIPSGSIEYFGQDLKSYITKTVQDSILHLGLLDHEASDQWIRDLN